MTDQIQAVKQENAALSLIEKSLENPEITPEKLSQLLAVKKEWEADEARKSFSRAMSDFQAECPAILKGRDMGRGILYAGKSDIEKTIKPILKQCGLSIMLTHNSIKDGVLTVEGQILHRDGHCSPIRGEVSIDSKMSVNDTQKVGSAISYAWRYIVCPAMGISLTDDTDDDGESAGSATIDDDQILDIEQYLGQLPAEIRKKVLGLCKVGSVEEIPLNMFPAVIKKLKLSLSKQEG